MIARIFAGTFILVGATNAHAQSGFESMQLAQQLGSVLASEQLCQLTYDQSAIEAFIEKKVKADDMGFTGTLQMMTEGTKVNLNEMSESQKTAQCAQIRRVAKSYGFIK